MTPQQAIQAIERGNLVTCTAEDYPDVRKAIQDQAAKWIDACDLTHIAIALSEVKRLDREFDYRIFSG